jgi:hypothetical protein
MNVIFTKGIEKNLIASLKEIYKIGNFRVPEL